MKKLILLSCLMWLAAVRIEAQQTVANKMLGKGLYRISIAGINAVALIDSAGNTLLSDNFKAEHASLFLAELERLGSQRIRFMINTHHHKDHCGGNLSLSSPVVISHFNTKKLLEFDYISRFWQDTTRAFARKSLPNLTFSDKMTIEFAGEKVELRHYPSGHSAADIIVCFQHANVVHLGDLLFSIGFPAIDFERGGSVTNFAANLKSILDNFNDETIFVAGHGKEFTRTELREYYEMMIASSEAVFSAMNQGIDLEQIKQRSLLKKWDGWAHGYFSCNDWAEILYYDQQWSDTLGRYFNLGEKTEKYIDSILPGNDPLIFAPGVITTKAYEGCSGFNREMDRFFFQRWLGGKPNLYETEFSQGKWSEPELIHTSFEAPIYDFTLSPDGKRLVFASTMQIARPGNDQKGQNIFFLERTDKGWRVNSTLPGMEVNTPYHDSYPCLAANGNLYFFSDRPNGYGKTDIYFSEFKDGHYNTAVNMGGKFNTAYDEWDPFIARDESYIIFCSKKPAGRGEDDLYVSFKLKNGEWSSPRAFNEKINTVFSENRPYVTPDGKFFMFTRNVMGNRDIYWVSAKIIEELRPKEN